MVNWKRENALFGARPIVNTATARMNNKFGWLLISANKFNSLRLVTYVH